MAHRSGPAECGRCEDIEWLLDVGADVTDIARRTRHPHMPAHRPDSDLRYALRKHLRLHGRDDLLDRIAARQERELVA